MICNYRLLNKRKDQYAGKIIESISIELNELQIDLDFIYLTEKNNHLPLFNKMDFTMLYEINKQLLQSFDQVNFSFCDICESIYLFGSPVEKNAIILLLKEINDSLIEYLNYFREI